METRGSRKKGGRGGKEEEGDEGEGEKYSKRNGTKTEGGFYPWMLSSEDCMKQLNVDPNNGLNEEQVNKLQTKYGYNELEKEPGRSFWAMVLEQFDDSLVKILLLAAVISSVIALVESYEEGEMKLDKFVEPFVILLILVLNAIVGVWQESNAEKSLEALMEMQSDVASVLRNGEMLDSHPARELVPGDIIEVRAGDRVPADCRLVKLKTTTLRVEQMALTGESMTVAKQVEPVESEFDPAELEIQGKINMLFAGTALANGHGVAVVTDTGMSQEIGKIQSQIQAATAALEDEKTPLKEKIDKFSDQLQYMIGAICLLVWLINIRMFFTFIPLSDKLWFVPNLWQGIAIKKALYYFQIAVALAVAAIPEGLPTVITLCLALGTRKMAKRNCIVRHLPAVETLGCTTVICSDKTGTLTTNQMSVRRVLCAAENDGKLKGFDVSGSTYNPNDGTVEGLPPSLNQPLTKIMEVCSICNESSIVKEQTVTGETKYRHVGAPTEAALKVLVEKVDISQNKERSDAYSSKSCTPACDAHSDRYDKVATLEFTRDRKSMGVIVRNKTNKNAKNELMVKGAPESILERCTHVLSPDGHVAKLTPQMRKQIESEVQHMAEKAWRTLACAVRTDLGELANYDGNSSHQGHKILTNPDNFAQVEQGMTWVGTVAMQDPPRAEVRASMESCRKAGIRVIIITGDNKLTAEAIAKDIGVFSPEDDMKVCSFVGSDFSRMPESEQRKILWHKDNVGRGLVFSRAEPKFKQDIVTLLKRGARSGENEVVAMTGDGVNDAPALKMANIGIAMGITGTEVAKEASDMVLADDNFSTIVAAVEEGRALYNNMKAFIRYMISSNIGEVASIFFTAALGFPEGMIPVQLLWVNLVTDGPPATALGFNKPEPDIMDKPPRKADDDLISRWTLLRYIIVGTYVGVATVGIFATWFTHGVGSEPFLGLLDLSQDGHQSVTLEQLMNHHLCDTTNNVFDLPSGRIDDFSKRTSSWTTTGPFGTETVKVSGCDYFESDGKMKASTLSLSVLVAIEMLNALNALSEDGSLLVVGPFSNPYLLLAIASSFILHAVILYIPMISPYFDVVALDTTEVLLVFLFSFPVIIIDEILKFIGRRRTNALNRQRMIELTEKKAV